MIYADFVSSSVPRDNENNLFNQATHKELFQHRNKAY